MNISKLTPEESLDRIKLMMNYDSSLTLNENTEIVKDSITEQLESPGGIAGKTAMATGGAAVAGGIAGGVAGATAAGGAAGYGAVGIGSALGYGSLAAAGAVGGAVIAGAAVLALAPLVLWLADKDKAYPKTKKLFEYVKTNKEKIDQVERGVSDDQIQELSDNLYNSMKGLGTRNKLMFQVFESLVTISDLSALIATFNEDHENEGKGDLLKWLDSDIDISSTWNRIYVPVRNLVKKFAKKLAAENPPSTKPVAAGAGAGAAVGSATGGYRRAEGTEQDPYKPGTSGDGIFKVQECIGVKADGKFGPITQAKLSEYAKVYSRAFTMDDIGDICKLANPRREPTIAPITPIPTQDKIIKSPVRMPKLAPKIDTSKLRPMNLSSLAPKI